MGCCWASLSGLKHHRHQPPAFPTASWEVERADGRWRPCRSVWLPPAPEGPRLRAAAVPGGLDWSQKTWARRYQRLPIGNGLQAAWSSGGSRGWQLWTQGLSDPAQARPAWRQLRGAPQEPLQEPRLPFPVSPRGDLIWKVGFPVEQDGPSCFLG